MQDFIHMHCWMMKRIIWKQTHIWNWGIQKHKLIKVSPWEYNYQMRPKVLPQENTNKVKHGENKENIQNNSAPILTPIVGGANEAIREHLNSHQNFQTVSQNGIQLIIKN